MTETVLPPEFQPLAEPLGELAIAWNLMEGEINLLLISITDSYYTDTAAVVFSELDMRGKIKAVKNCGFLKRPNNDWFDRLEAELNEIDTVHRPARNRFTHDHLISQGGVVSRTTIEMKLEKPRTKQRSLLLRNFSKVSKEEIRALAVTLRKSEKALRDLREEFERLVPRTGR